MRRFRMVVGRWLLVALVLALLVERWFPLLLPTTLAQVGQSAVRQTVTVLADVALSPGQRPAYRRWAAAALGWVIGHVGETERQVIETYLTIRYPPPDTLEPLSP